MNFIIACLLIMNSTCFGLTEAIIAHYDHPTPLQLIWSQNQKGFDFFKDGEFGQALACFEKTYFETLNHSSQKDFENAINASLFGLVIACDQLNKLDTFYKNLGMGVIDLLISLDDQSDEDDRGDEDFFDELSFHTQLSQEDLLTFANQCKKEKAKKIALSLLQDY